MAALHDDGTGADVRRSGLARALWSAAEQNRRTALDAVRKVEELERRVHQSRRMIEQTARTVEATHRRQAQLDRLGR